jgi:multidrug resistance efflux pump
MECVMMRKARSLSVWLGGLILLAGSVTGTFMVLHSRAGDGAAPAPPETVSAAPRGEGVICIGHVDVEPGVRSLYPLQPGRIVEVLVREEDAVSKGAVLLRLDDRPAKFLVEQAKADLQAAELQLTDARRLPQQHKIKISQQKLAIQAIEHRLSAARHGLSRKLSLVKGGNASSEEGDAATDLVHELEAAVEVEKDKLRELELIDPTTKITLAEADISAKRSKLSQAEYALDECSLRAPEAGKILRVLVGAGDLLAGQPRQPAIEFCPESPRIVRAEVEQEFANRVVKGQIATIEDDSRATVKWQGKVMRVGDWYTHRRSILQEPLQFNDVRTLECIIQIDPSETMPRIGQRVRVYLGQPPTGR